MNLTFRNILVDTEARVILIRRLILFTVFFPFIPSIIRSADTQPTFMLLMGFIGFYTFMQKGERFFEARNMEAFLAVFLGFLVASSVLINFIYSQESFHISRIIAFVQFTLAIIFGLTFRFHLEDKDFKTIVLIYVIFTIFFYLSNGLIEDLLIGSRNESTEVLMRTGRGAKTLSPEPSFFALQIFNIIIIYFLLFKRHASHSYEKSILYLSFFCLIASFSGYGIIILIALILVRFTKQALVALAGLVIVFPFLIPSIDSFKYIRAVGLLLSFFEKNPLLVLQQDHSIIVRLGSFLAYIENIVNHLAIGDGFTLLKGGGFISIISSLGIMALIFFLFLILEIIFLRGFSIRKRLLLLFWFMLNLLSGPIAVPAIGVIVGLIIRNNHPGIFPSLHNYPFYARQ